MATQKKKAAKKNKKTSKKAQKKASRKTTKKAPKKIAKTASKKAKKTKASQTVSKKASAKSKASKKKTNKAAKAKKTSSKKAVKTVSGSKKKITSAKKTKSAGAKSAPKTKTKSVTQKSKTTTPASVVSKTSLKVGDRVPHFVAQATKGTVSLDGLKGKKVVIYFYPKDHTPGCTIEGHDFSKALPEFTSHNTLVYGVSRDSLSSHASFIDKQCYTIDLISDPEEKLCQIFGVMAEKSLYGRQYIGVDRSTFLIDESGVVTHVWRNVKVDGHVDEVLKAAKGES
ncbi:MAG: peroxiredoxin [Bdellovibrionaceae bacterium]|nr:peroxiredoxin [Pseudobdellovibrionaceae bacterium]